MATGNLLWQSYEHYRLQFMIDSKVYLSDLMALLSDLLDGYDPEARGNFDNEPYVALMDVWGDLSDRHDAVGPDWLTLREWLEDAWSAFEDQVVGESECIVSPFLLYPEGAPKDEIWYDFDQLYAEWGGIAALSGQAPRLEVKYVEFRYESNNYPDGAKPYTWSDLFELTVNVPAAKFLADMLSSDLVKPNPTPNEMLKQLIQAGFIAPDESGADGYVLVKRY